MDKNHGYELKLYNFTILLLLALKSPGCVDPRKKYVQKLASNAKTMR